MELEFQLECEATENVRHGTAPRRPSERHGWSLGQGSQHDISPQQTRWLHETRASIAALVASDAKYLAREVPNFVGSAIPWLRVARLRSARIGDLIGIEAHGCRVRSWT
jgi:hypothetical protein